MKSLSIGILLIIGIILVTELFKDFMDIRPLIVVVLLIVGIILAVQMFIGFIKIRMDKEQRLWLFYIKEYSLKAFILLLGLYCLNLINNLMQ